MNYNHVFRFNISAFLVFILILESLVACSGVMAAASMSQTTALPSHVVTDMAGRAVTVPSEITNILALFGPAYEKIVILDAEDKIGMCADFHKAHASWAHVIYKRLDSVPAMSNPTNPNMENVLTDKPDVVFYFGNDKNTEKMESLGIPVICSV